MITAEDLQQQVNDLKHELKVLKQSNAAMRAVFREKIGALELKNTDLITENSRQSELILEQMVEISELMQMKTYKLGYTNHDNDQQN